MFDAILYFYQSKGVFKPPTNIDEDIVNNELEFYKISLDKIFADVEQASKKMLVPTSAKQKVSFPMKSCDKFTYWSYRCFCLILFASCIFTLYLF